jgi:hypothetical protein
MKEQSTIFLNQLIEVLLNNFIYYIPSEIIFDGVLDELEGEIEDSFFDELSLLDINQGIYNISNDDALELNNKLLEKRSLLEKNIFDLIQINKDITPIEFQIIVEKYFKKLFFYLFISDWLATNLKRYNEENLNITLIGAFELQHQSLSSHLIEVHKYFGLLIENNQEYNFSSEKLVREHFPDLVSRYNQIVSNETINNEDKIIAGEKKLQHKVQHQSENNIKPIKKQRPTLSDKEVERTILESVFKVKMN